LSERGENLDKALEMTRKSNSLSPDNPTFLDTYAWVLYKSENYEEALQKMERVIELSDNASGEVLEHYGDILLRNNQPEKALEQYERARKLGGASGEIDKKINSLSAP